MHKGRLEAFSDGVMAIIITIMVLELKPPHGADLSVLRELLPVFGSYVLSFVYVGIYWNNHHHLMHAAQRVNGSVLWANLHLLFWLSLTPFASAWLGENHFAPWPVAIYGVVLFCSGLAYYVLVQVLIPQQGKGSALEKAVGADLKGKLSLVIYGAAIALAFLSSWMAFVLYVLVALIWLVPDRRIERALAER